MTSYHMARCDLRQCRLFMVAGVDARRTAVAERAARRQIKRTGGLALDILDFLGKIHLDVKHGIQKRP